MKRATYADLLAVPDNLIAEILDGELVVSPRPASRHSRASSMLGNDLGNPFDRGPGEPQGPGGWWILDEPELHFMDDVLVPDLAAWRRERMPAIPDVPAFTLAPDWVCEVLSPSTARIDRVRKMAIYSRNKVGHLWLVEPTAHTLEVYRLENDHWVVVSTHAGNERVRADPFAEVEVEMGRWWIDPDAGT